MEDSYNLFEVFRNNDVVLFDTSAFNSPYDPLIKGKNIPINIRKDNLLERMRYLDYLYQLAQSDKFQVIKHVHEELIPGQDYKNHKKKVNNFTKNGKKATLSPELVKRQTRKLTKLTNLLEHNNQILDTRGILSQNYIDIYDKYNKFKVDGRLSDTDYHQIVMGLFLSFHNRDVSLVSSDMGMFRVHREITKNREDIYNKFTFHISNTDLHNKIYGQN